MSLSDNNGSKFGVLTDLTDPSGLLNKLKTGDSAAKAQMAELARLPAGLIHGFTASTGLDSGLALAAATNRRDADIQTLLDKYGHSLGISDEEGLRAWAAHHPNSALAKAVAELDEAVQNDPLRALTGSAASAGAMAMKFSGPFGWVVGAGSFFLGEKAYDLCNGDEEKKCWQQAEAFFQEHIMPKCQLMQQRMAKGEKIRDFEKVTAEEVFVCKVLSNAELRDAVQESLLKRHGYDSLEEAFLHNDGSAIRDVMQLHDEELRMVDADNHGMNTAKQETLPDKYARWINRGTDPRGLLSGEMQRISAAESEQLRAALQAQAAAQGLRANGVRPGTGVPEGPAHGLGRELAGSRTAGDDPNDPQFGLGA